MLIFDLESDGFLDVVTKVHVLVIKDTESGVTDVYNSQRGDLEEGIRRLMDAEICGHNVIKYDLPVLQKLYPWFTFNKDKVVDTLVLSRLVFPDLVNIDLKLMAKGQLAKKNYKRHSLEAWGQRLNCLKGEYTGGWAEWNQEMEDYCVQDVVVTSNLYDKLMSKNPSELSMWIEHQVQWIIARQERYGFLFHKEKASKLYSKLVKRKHEIETELRDGIAPIYVRNGKVLIPKKDNKARNYTQGAPLTKVELVQFNPGSRDHIAKVLQYRRGWTPTEWTDGGKPQIDEVVLAKLPFPEAKPLTEYFTVVKRIAQIAEGDEAWLKHVKPSGRIHGGVITNGAVTGRMSHSKPNLAQVPAGYSPYGHECRECFYVPPNKKQVGIDASALELRDFAGYLARYDNGAYVLTVTKGRKEDGTEIHTVNRKALGIESRDIAKTWFYAFLYGAGDEKLGIILGYKPGMQARKAGSASRKKFVKNLPALGKLVSAVKDKVKAQGFLKGLDGRILHIRSEHSALNTLLQSAGAIQMKMALVIFDQKLQSAGYVPGVNYEYVANVHDEWQIECDKEIADAIGKMGVESIREAGEKLNFKCPLDGEYKVGTNWAETH